jgi:hypothetical protein
MKQMLLTILFALFVSFIVNAQTSETVSKLSPLSANIGKFSKHPPKKIRDLIIGTYKIKFDVSTELINLADGKKGIAVKIKISNKELGFESIGGKQTARISIYGRITSKNRKIDGFFEEGLDTVVTEEELANGTNKSPVTLRKVFELPKGKYQIGVIVRDITSGMHGIKVVKFQR